MNRTVISNLYRRGATDALERMNLHRPRTVSRKAQELQPQSPSSTHPPCLSGGISQKIVFDFDMTGVFLAVDQECEAFPAIEWESSDEETDISSSFRLLNPAAGSCSRPSNLHGSIVKDDEREPRRVVSSNDLKHLRRRPKIAKGPTRSKLRRTKAIRTHLSMLDTARLRMSQLECDDDCDTSRAQNALMNFKISE